MNIQQYGVAISQRNHNNFVVDSNTLTNDYTTAVLELKNRSSLSPDIYEFAIVVQNEHGYKVDRESIITGAIPLEGYQVEFIPAEEIVLN